MSTGWKKYRELISGVAFLIFSVAYYLNASTIKVLSPNSGNYINGQFFPKLMAVFMGIVSICQIYGGIKLNGGKSKTDAAPGAQGASLDRAGVMRILATLISLAVYVALIKTAGFLLMTILYVFAQTFILIPREKRNLPFMVILDIVFSVAVYFIFVHGFQLMLPRGPLPF